jgi:rhodanese-related sulfurtransferase
MPRRRWLTTALAGLAAVGGSRHRPALAVGPELALPETAVTHMFDFETRGIEEWTSVTGQWAVEEMAGAPSDIMEGAVWRDPERIDDWIGDLSKSDPVVVFCAYGFHVGCKTAIALRDAGYDAKYMKGGHSAWKAIGGPIKLHRPS